VCCSYSRYREAERWCGLGMRMLGHLDTVRDKYQEHVRDNSHITQLGVSLIVKLDREIMANFKTFYPSILYTDTLCL